MSDEIDRAVAILRRGGLVAFPTETVYGLGADATNSQAVRRIFAAKGRPSTNPLICHVADEMVARRYAAAWPLASSRLAQAFWPGPLTLVLPKSPEIVADATAGLSTVGLRAPNDPLTLELLRRFDRPLAGPSANKSSHVSPTTAQHVRDELSDGVDLILDGGACDVGIESTVIDLSGEIPTILRPGAITIKQIANVIGEVKSKTVVAEATTPSIAPGQHAKHYAPRSPAYRFDARQRERLDLDGALLLELTGDPSQYARTLYARLRELDAKSPRCIYVEMPPETPEWTAVRDRLMRATKALSDAPPKI